MTTKLSLYNAALSNHLGSRKLKSLSEARRSRRALDSVWDNNFVRRILESGQWDAATRTFKSTYDPDVTTQFGYKYAHKKPTDWVRTLGVSLNENMEPPLNNYKDEGGYWLCDEDELYVSIVSDDVNYGGDLSLWPESITAYAELELAYLACKAITDSDVTKDELFKKAQRAKREAKSIDAMNGPTRTRRYGSWVNARRRGTSQSGSIEW